ncbi:hypothetical protein GJV85_06230 [Sulfurimonas aquatica]|uniref:TonB C-terminal domain-containing protein n=1 Tax=Sulfurimonas aquatica TaxID=2672570 RepID=A0A975GCK6_9BACT|nr:energy transducer TonB [Sulfurimonas aquatica]QSZ41720.1 hypothetical protein GJV85_06230 [Sulfurimonas aquatica]
MNRSTFALFVALLIHIIFMLLFWIVANNSISMKVPNEQEKKIKISLKELPQKHKESGLDKKVPKPKEIAPPMPKGKQLEKIIKQEPLKYNPSKKPEEPHLNVDPEPKPTLPKEEILTNLPSAELLIPFSEEEPIDEKPKQQKVEEDPMAWMYEDKSKEEKKTKTVASHKGGNLSQNIKELYGDEFGKLSPGQQEYIIDNQEIMRRITQEVLTRVARVNIAHNLSVNSSNVVEFYIHPNGDMTDFKFLSKSGHYVLDDTTKETIEYAYSRYPRPTEKTLVRYNVYYNLARY